MTQKATLSPNHSIRRADGPAGQRNSVSSRVFDIFNYVFVTLVAFTTILPFIYIIGASFATEYELSTRPMFIIPRDVTLDSYRYIFSSNKILGAFGNSVFITAAGTAVNLFFTVTMAYAISKKRLRGRTIVLNMVIFSMFFSGGMIPSFIVISSWLKMKNTYWSVIIPGAISAYNMMIVKNFFQGIPQELEESAYIDGAGEVRTLVSIVLPLSTAIIATMALFYGVGNWNEFTAAIIYNHEEKYYPIQVIIQRMYSESVKKVMDDEVASRRLASEAIKSATVVFGTLPIVCVYPFLQKHFAKGVMVGSLKG
mgnify:CR=1 FL=1